MYSMLRMILHCHAMLVIFEQVADSPQTKTREMLINSFLYGLETLCHAYGLRKVVSLVNISLVWGTSVPNFLNMHSVNTDILSKI